MLYGATSTWPGPGSLLFSIPLDAVAKGLFGPGTPHPRLSDRLGDLIVAARNDAYLWWADKDNHARSAGMEVYQKRR